MKNIDQVLTREELLPYGHSKQLTHVHDYSSYQLTMQSTNIVLAR